MATTPEESVILNIEVKTADAIKGIGELNDNILALKKSQEQLDKDFKDGTKTFEEYSKETKKNSSDLREQEKAFKTLTNAVNVQEGSINELRESTKRLTAERNNLNLNTAEGRTRLKEINDQIDKNNNKIKENVSQLEKQKINIGNYASALDGVKGSLDKVVPGLSGMTDGIIGVSNGAKTLGATPLLGIFTILSTVLPVVLDYFKSFAPVMDAIEDTVNAVSGTFKGLFENFDLLIKAIGGSGKDWDALKTAINETRAEGQRLLDVQRELDDAYLNYQLRAAKGGVEIKKLLLEAKNRTLTERERQDKLNQALAIEVGQREELIKLDKTAFENAVDNFIFDNTKRLKATQDLIDLETKRADNQIAQESRFGTLSAERREKILAERDAEIERIKTSDVLINQLKQTEDRYEKLQLLRQSGLFQEEDLQKAVDLFVKYQGTVEGGVAIQERIQNQLDALADKESQRLIKANEEAEKKKEADQKELERLIELNNIEQGFAEAERNRISNLNQFKIDSQKSVSENIKSIARNNEDELIKIAKKAKKDKEALDKQEIINANAKEKQLSDLRDQALFSLSTVFQKNKDVQIALALVSTYLSAQKAFESQFQPVADVTSPLRGAAAAALAVIQGLARVQAIRSVDSSGGSASAPSVSGSSTSSGITSTRATTNPINERFNLANANQGMTVVASWQEATTVRNRVEFKEQLTTA